MKNLFTADLSVGSALIDATGTDASSNIAPFLDQSDFHLHEVNDAVSPLFSSPKSSVAPTEEADVGLEIHEHSPQGPSDFFTWDFAVIFEVGIR